MTNYSELEQLIKRYDKAVAGLEDDALQRLSDSLDAAFRNLERELRRLYPEWQSQGSLYAAQRRLLLLSELGDLLSIIRPDQDEEYQQLFEELLQISHYTGTTLADELTNIVAPTYPLHEFSTIPIEAAALQAQEGVKRLYRYDEEFRTAASGIIEQGLIQGWGANKVAQNLRSRLGVTKSKAETLARTEVMSAVNDAAQQRYAENGIEGMQWMVTPSDALCPVCADRNGNVYKVGEVRLPAHPRCRCMILPWKKSWQKKGLTDDAFMEGYSDRNLKALAAAGLKPDSGPTYWEKKAGAKAAPTPIWKPGDTPPPPKPTHQQFIELGQEEVASLGRRPSVADMAKLRESLLGNATQAEKLASGAGISKTAQKLGGEDLRSDLAEFHALTGGATQPDFSLISVANQSLPFADLKRRAVNLGDRYDKADLFHEVGHFLEADNPALAEAARAWRDSRATGPAQSLNRLTGTNQYKANESALPDSFASPYVGKVYDSGLTEVVATGMEHFADPESMAKLLERDPEHFQFMVGAMKAAQQQNFNSGQRVQADERLFQSWNGYRPLTPVEEAMQKSQAKLAGDFDDYLKREAESIRRRTSGEIDRQLKEYYDAEAARLRERLGIQSPANATPAPPTSSGKGLQIRSYDRDVEPVRVKPLDVDESWLNAKGKAALAVVRVYEQVIDEINETIAKIPKSGKQLPPDAYDRIYAKIDGLTARLTGTVNASKSLVGTSGNTELDSRLSQIARISKESLPGYKIQPPSKDLVQKSAARPC